jgi:LPXTG-motif cell wall-anchored protein
MTGSESEWLQVGAAAVVLLLVLLQIRRRRRRKITQAQLNRWFRRRRPGE